MLLDASGSMANSWDEMLGSINRYASELPGDAEITLSAFDSGYEMNFRTLRNTTARNWKSVTKEDAMPGGGTPLVDASTRILHRMIDDDHSRAVFVLITDGEENASKHFKKTDVDKLLAHVKKKDWQTLFIGANFDKVKDVATSYGLQQSSFVNMSTRNYTSTMDLASNKTANYMATGAAMAFTDEEKAGAVK
jgi:hypothetical protein